MARRPLLHTISQLSRTRQRGAVIRKVASHLGLVYFGALGHDDEHEVIRGITVSTSHRDSHFATGTFDGYDISLVDRDDIIREGTSSSHRRWAIVQVSLKRTLAVREWIFLPHDHRHHYAHALTGLRHLQPIDALVAVPYSPECLRRYSLMAPSHQALDVHHVITPALADLAAIKLWPHAVELKDDRLLVYITEDRLNETVLRVAIESALWLADSLDQRA